MTAALFLSAFFYAFPRLTEKPTEEKMIGAVRLWNVDTFEGGRGSRTNFLNTVSSAYEKSKKNVFVLVSSYTVEGAVAALNEGNVPDMISFGLGLPEVFDHIQSTFFGKSFFVDGKMGDSGAGGAIEGEQFAWPWCKGTYALYSQTDDFSAVCAENTVISVGGENRVQVAAALSGLKGKTNAEVSTAAYVSFLKGKYRYMLGTQRDACRFETRGANVYARPLEEFCDLYQYIAVLATEQDRLEICKGYLDLLFSEKYQKRLSTIGMLSPYFDIYPKDQTVFYALQEGKPQRTLSVFTSREGLSSLDGAAAQAILDGNTEVLKKFLKAL